MSYSPGRIFLHQPGLKNCRYPGNLKALAKSCLSLRRHDISALLTMNYKNERLVVLDADGTTINAFDAIGKTFALHGMGLGDLMRFQKRHNIFKYLGGLKEFPVNLRQQMSKKKRKVLIKTLTEIYREEGVCMPASPK